MTLRTFIASIFILVHGKSRWKIYQMTAQQQLPSIRIGKRLRFRRDDLEAWLDGLSIDAREQGDDNE